MFQDNDETLLAFLFKPQCTSLERKDLVHNTWVILSVTYGAVSRTGGFLDQLDDETSRHECAREYWLSEAHSALKHETLLPILWSRNSRVFQ